MPMCPIVSDYGMATYNTAKFITTILQNYCGKTSSFVKDSTDVIKKIKHLSINPEEETLLSFGVSALFTSMPVSQAQKLGYGTDETVCVWLLETTGWRHWWMCRQVGMTLLCMCKVFPTWRGTQKIVTSLDDISHYTYVRGRELYKEACMSFRALIWVLAAVHLVALG